jgi:hypothetical protein
MCLSCKASENPSQTLSWSFGAREARVGNASDQITRGTAHKQTPNISANPSAYNKQTRETKTIIAPTF